jgi:tRNA(fMet)-specific endonuclease VapC
MKYLLDTCVITDFIKKDFRTRNNIKKIFPDKLALSIISVFEIRYGIELIKETKKGFFIEEMSNELITQINKLYVDEVVAIEAAKIRAELKKEGCIIGAYDILIAATAKAHDLIIVTSNEKEFKRVSGLKLENWRGA